MPTPMNDRPDRPSHIIEKVSDVYPWFADVTLCGTKTSTPEGIPHCGSHVVQGHIDGRDPLWCEACATAWEGLPPTAKTDR